MYRFPDPRDADEEGVVAVGGPFHGERLLAAYRQGVFPWSGDPVRWHSPDPRAIFWQVRLPRRLRRTVRRGGFTVTFDRAFDDVIQACADVHREEGEWITPTFVRGYGELHRMGYAHSVEVWRGGELAGGLYGVQVAGLFAGESMFYRVSNASKVAFAALAHQLLAIGVTLFDCQVLTMHTLRLGAVLVRRDDYLRMLALALAEPARHHGQPWPIRGSFDADATALEDALDAEGGDLSAAGALEQERRHPQGAGPRFWALER